MPEEHFGLPLHIVAVTAVEDTAGSTPVTLAGDAADIDVLSGHVAGLQPLSHKVLHHAVGFAVLQHTVDLRSQIMPQFSFRG